MKKKKLRPVVVFEYNHDNRAYYLVHCPRRVSLLTIYKSGNALVDDVLLNGCELKIIPYEKCTENPFHVIELESCPF